MADMYLIRGKSAVAVGVDPEVKAMTDVLAAIEPLDEEARSRVLQWVVGRLGVSGVQAGRVVQQRRHLDADLGEDGEETADRRYADFVDLFDATRPQTDAERALVGAYWFQVELKNANFNAQQVNGVLKDVGHGVGNITAALSDLQERTPSLVRQMAKSGKTRQARKTYKLTVAGQRAVDEMLGETAE